MNRFSKIITLQNDILKTLELSTLAIWSRIIDNFGKTWRIVATST